MERKIKQAILFLSNKTSESIINEFKLLSTSIGDLADVYFIYHQNTPEIPEQIKSLNYYSFTNDILHELNFIPLENSLLPGCDHFPLFKFYLDHPDYDYYWHIEDDIRFFGNWKYIFESFQNHDADFISSHIQTKKENPHWHWWNSLTKDGKTIPLENTIKSFNAIHRISNKAIRFLHSCLSDGWSGHHEVVIPTLLYRNNFKIIDFGGDGSFVPEGNRNKFYTNESMTYIPIKCGNVKNRIYHPVKEFKKNCVISAVGQISLHKNWVHKDQNFDLHLIVYDDSYSLFKNDSAYVSSGKGYKLNLVYRYLKEHPEYLEQYDYFFIPDDDILMDHESIGQLFGIMKEYSLSITQPALFDSYYTYESLIRNKFTKLRYTDFIEMMLPCFSRDALKKVLFTFNENNGGWGADFHWKELIGFSGKEMAVIDETPAIHTRPVQSVTKSNIQELHEYSEKYNLRKEIKEYGFVPTDKINNTLLVVDINKYKIIKSLLNTINNRLLENLHKIKNLELPYYKMKYPLFFINHYKLTGNRKSCDHTFYTFSTIQKLLNTEKNGIRTSELTTIALFVEYLAQNGYIENNTDEILEEIIPQINAANSSDWEGIDLNENLLEIGIYYLSRTKNPNFSLHNEIHSEEKKILENIINSLQNILQKKDKYKLSDKDIADILLFITQYNSLKDKESVRLTNQEIYSLKETCLRNLQNDNKDPFSFEQFYNNLYLGYALFRYLKISDKRENAENIVKEILNHSEKIIQKDQINNCTFHEFIRLAYIHFYFYIKSDMQEFKKLSSSYLDKAVYEFNIHTEYRIQELTECGLILTSLLSETELNWNSLMQ